MPPSRATLELLAAQLKTLSEAIGGEAIGELSAQRVKRVRHTITEAYEQLRRVTEHLDPVWCEKAAEARSVLVESPK